jgi:hypothetical protein
MNESGVGTPATAHEPARVGRSFHHTKLALRQIAANLDKYFS